VNGNGSGNGKRKAEDASFEALLIARKHFSDLMAASTALRRDSRALLERLKESLQEMRTLRSQLPIGQRADPRVRPPEIPLHLRVQLQFGLTPREAEIALLLSEGKSNSEISAALQISPHTARHHTQRVLGKLAVASRAAVGARLRQII
jgi:DNA-binding CsgD family transcriptional regulator